MISGVLRIVPKIGLALLTCLAFALVAAVAAPGAEAATCEHTSMNFVAVVDGHTVHMYTLVGEPQLSEVYRGANPLGSRRSPRSPRSTARRPTPTKICSRRSKP
jgi:hypothetical protein